MTHFNITAKKIWVAGHRGMVGSALLRRLEREDCEIITAMREELDLRDASATHAFAHKQRPDAVILAAAKVGGILANADHPVEFLADNLAIELNVINAAHQANVQRLIFLGSSCIYPKFAENPIPEEALLTGPLEPTNEAYAIAKIAGLKLCQAYRKQYDRDYISCMPTNLYGPHDNFDLQSSHVLAALIAKAYQTKIEGKQSVEVWGSGEPLREFLHVDDCADAVIFLMSHYSSEIPINVGSGEEVRISELATLVLDAAGLDSVIAYDRSKPDGTPRKLLDSSRLQAMGWKPRIALKDGIADLYHWYVEHKAS